jgi:hypothetical protein
MAEIHVETKRRAPVQTWIWIVVAIVIIAIIVFFIARNRRTTQSNTVNRSNTTSYVVEKNTPVLYM